jgi:hypothetical protein
MRLGKELFNKELIMEDKNIEEDVLYKDKRKADRILRTKNKIKSRKKKIFDVLVKNRVCISEPDITNFDKIADSYFENNSICNTLLGTRVKLKTKTKHGCQVYRHHNIYGKAIRYANHDLKQIANLKYELKDNDFNHYIKGGEKV